MAKSETYEELTKRLEKEKADIDRRLANAKTAKEEKERAIDRDRKILLGAYLLNKLGKEGERGPIRSMLNQDLPGYLTRDRDKELLIDFMGNWKPPVKEKKVKAVDSSVDSGVAVNKPRAIDSAPAAGKSEFTKDVPVSEL